MTKPNSVALVALLLGAIRTVIAQDLNVPGNLDVNGNTASFGTSGANPGYTLLYTDGTSANIDFSASAAGANWTWSQNLGNPQLKLSANNTLSLFPVGTTTPTITLSPAGPSTFFNGISIGTPAAGAALSVLASGSPLDTSGYSDRGQQVVFVGPNKSISYAENAGQIGIFANDAGPLADAGGSIVFGAVYNTANNMAMNAAIKSGRDDSSNNSYGGYLSFFTRTNGFGAAERFRVTSTGNVGIGTLAPTEKLEVNGNLKVSGSIIGATFPSPTFTGTTSLSGATSKLIVGGASSPATTWQGAIVSGADGQNKVIMGSLNSTYSGATIGGHNSTLMSWADLNLNGANLIFRTSGETEVARLNGDGNLGIGTTTPTARLEISSGKGNYYDGDLLKFFSSAEPAAYSLKLKSTVSNGLVTYSFDTRNANADYLNNLVIERGNIGIGTASPTARLDVVGNIAAAHIISQSNQGDSAYYGRQVGSGFANALPVFQAVSDNPNGLANNFFSGKINGPAGTETFSIRADGLIKSASLAGTGSTFLVAGADGSVQRATTSITAVGSNVGIGTSTPADTLTANGNIRALATNNGGFVAYDSPSGGNHLFSFVRGNASNNLDISSYDGIGFATGATSGPSTNYSLFIANNGNVGVGTTTPSSKLTVKGGHATTQLRLFSDEYGQGQDGVNTALLSLWASEPGWSWGGVGIGNNAVNSGGINRITNARGGSYARFLSNQVSINTIDDQGSDRLGLFINNGNVGVGTTNVYGGTDNMTIEGMLQVSASGSDATAFAVKGNGEPYAALKIKIGPPHTAGGPNYYDFTVRPNYWNGVGAGGDVSAIRISNTYSHNAPDVILVKDGGNVGIGTINPSSRLDVVGDAKIQGSLMVNGSAVLTAASANIARLDQSPVFTPSSYGAYNEGIRVNDAPNGYSLLKLGGSGSTGTTPGSWTIFKNPSGEFGIHNGDQERVRFTADRNRFLGALTAGRLVASGASNIENYGVNGAWTGASLATNSIEIVNNEGVVNNTSPTLAFHRYGSGGPQFRLAADGSNVLYLESAGANSATQPTPPPDAYFNKLQITGGLEVSKNVTVSGATTLQGPVAINNVVTVNKRVAKLRVEQQGDLSMGTFTAGSDIP